MTDLENRIKAEINERRVMSNFDTCDLLTEILGVLVEQRVYIKKLSSDCVYALDESTFEHASVHDAIVDYVDGGGEDSEVKLSKRCFAKLPDEVYLIDDFDKYTFDIVE